MEDIFNTNIVCNKCNTKTNRILKNINNFKLRTWQCPNCKKEWIHPLDQKNLQKFNKIKNKNYSVKLRVVGNSYTVSIPKEIILFHQLEKEVNKIIKMSLEEPEKLSLFFKTKKLINR